MPNNFKVIYRILSILEKSMEYEEFDTSSIQHEALGISYPLWGRLMTMLSEEGYITGISVWQPLDSVYPKLTLANPQITLKGLEYLEENPLMQSFRLL